MSPPSDPFAALGHPVRRGILDLLRAQPGRKAGEIAAAFPEISRAAVSKHLGVLRRARLVRARKTGREWHYSLDSRSLRELYEEWLGRFAELSEGSLQQLKERVEARDG